MQTSPPSSPSHLSHVSATRSSVSPTQPPPSPCQSRLPAERPAQPQFSVPITSPSQPSSTRDRFVEQHPAIHPDSHPQPDAQLQEPRYLQTKVVRNENRLYAHLLRDREPVRAFPAIRLLDDSPAYVTTQCATLNAALNPGLHPRRVTQLAGQSLTGKTAIALEFAKSVLFANGGVLWFETTHSPWEIHTRLSASLSQSPATTPVSRSDVSASDSPAIVTPHSRLRLAVFPVPTFDTTMLAMSAVQRDILLLRGLEHLPTTGDTQSNNLVDVLCNLKLVVFDSVATILSPLLGLRLPLAWTGHVALDQISALLRWFATETCSAVLITNRLVATNAIAHPALGLKWASFVDVSITLLRDSDANLENNSFNSASLPPTSIVSVNVTSKFDRSRACRIALTDDGLSDINKV